MNQYARIVQEVAVPDDPKAKDGWDKAAIVGNLLSAMILPFALLAAGHFLNQAATLREEMRRDAERQAEDDRVRLDRANGLLESLASESARRRRVAVEWAKYLERIKQLPPEATTILLELALTDTDSDVASVAGTVTASVAEGDADLRELAAARFARNPALVQRSNLIAAVVNALVKEAEGETSGAYSGDVRGIRRIEAHRRRVQGTEERERGYASESAAATDPVARRTPPVRTTEP